MFNIFRAKEEREMAGIKFSKKKRPKKKKKKKIYNIGHYTYIHDWSNPINHFIITFLFHLYIFFHHFQNCSWKFWMKFSVHNHHHWIVNSTTTKTKYPIIRRKTKIPMFFFPWCLFDGIKINSKIFVVVFETSKQLEHITEIWTWTWLRRSFLRENKHIM